MEARVRIELTREGFADLSLATWVPRPVYAQSVKYSENRRARAVSWLLR